MDPARVQFPWRPLGALLVDEGLLTPAQLELALIDQRRSGRLLGQILVDRGYVTGLALARVLSAQHGVELRPAAVPDEEADETEQVAGPATEPAATASWRPLGKLLVERGFVGQDELAAALAEQRRSG